MMKTVISPPFSDTCSDTNTLCDQSVMAAITIAEIRTAVSAELITCSGSPIDGDASSWDADFYAEWYRAHDIVGTAFRASPPPPEVQSDANELRSTIFQFVMTTTGDDALAAYTGDDFRLLINASLLGVDDSWISNLWNTYRNGRSPYVEAT